MKERNKRNLTIGILCCLLVFMGIGFAVMNATLKVEGTATAINTWDVRMTKIEVTEKSDGASNNEELTKINDDGVTATFRSDFTKPGDYITYEVTVENRGSIDAVLNDISVTLNVSETDKDLFNITDTRPNNQLLEAGTSITFTIKVEFRSDADRMPSGDIEYTVKVDYSQQTGELGGEEEYEDWLYKIDESGTITAYNYDSKLVEDTSIVVVPATIDGIPVKRIDKNSFLKFNAGMFQNADGTGGVIIYDNINYEAIVEKCNELIDVMGSDYEGLRNYYREEDSNIPTNVELQKIYIDITKSGAEIIGKVGHNVEQLHLTNATNLEIIDDYSFSASEALTTLKSVEFPQNGALKVIGKTAFYNNTNIKFELSNTIETIKRGAFGSCGIKGELSLPNSIVYLSGFAGNQITSVVIPDSVKTIGTSAFNSNQISGELIIPDSVIEIEGEGTATENGSSFLAGAFEDNKIDEVNFGKNIKIIGHGAFAHNQISGELIIPDTVQEIGISAFKFNKITSVIIPKSVTSIWKDAFIHQSEIPGAGGSSILKSITIKRTEQDFLTNVYAPFIWYEDGVVLNYDSN